MSHSLPASAGETPAASNPPPAQPAPSEKALGKRKRSARDLSQRAPRAKAPVSDDDFPVDDEELATGIIDDGDDWSSPHPRLHDPPFAPHPNGYLEQWMTKRHDFAPGVKRIVGPVPIYKPIVYLRDLDAQVVAGRQYFCQSLKTGKSPYSMLDRTQSYVVGIFTNRDDNMSLPVDIWTSCTPNGSKKELGTVAEKMCMLLNCMPADIRAWLSENPFLENYRKAALVYSAASSLYPDHSGPVPLAIQLKTWKRDSSEFVGLGKTEEVFKLKLMQIPDHVIPPDEVLPTPDRLTFVEDDRKKAGSNDSYLPRCYSLMKHALWELFGAIGTNEALKRRFVQVTFYERVTKGLNKTLAGPYDNGALWTQPEIKNGKLRFYMPSPVKEDLGISKRDRTTFVSDGLSRKKAAFILENMYQTFQKGHGYLNGWQAGLVAAERLIQNLQKAIITCDGLEEHHGHVCSGCYVVWNCSDLNRMTVYGCLCFDCKTRVLFDGPSSFEDEDVDDGATPASKMSGPSKYFVPQTRTPIFASALANTLSTFKNEARAFVDIAPYLPSNAQLGTFVEERIGVTTWKDVYSNVDRDVATGRVASRYYAKAIRADQANKDEGKYPFQPSPDASFPFALVPGANITAIHTLENVVFTALYLNLLKNQYLPGVLGLIGEAQALRWIGNTDPSWKELNARFDHQCILTNLTPKLKKHRVLNTMTAEEYENQKARWVSGQCGYSEATIGVQGFSSLASWKPNDLDRIVRVIGQIERHNHPQ